MLHRRIQRLTVAAALCLALCFGGASLAEEPRHAGASTEVQFRTAGVEITGMTEDCTVAVGGNQTLAVSANGLAPLAYAWEVSTNGTSFSPIDGAAAATYQITNAQANAPVATVPYTYRVTVTDSDGISAQATVNVLVANAYAYRTVSLRNGDTDVSAYMHDTTRLVVTPLPDSDPAAVRLAAYVAADCAPLKQYDVSLVNSNNQVVPYFGRLRVEFDVGAQYNGQTLRALHLYNNHVDEHTGTVANGMLPIVVDALSPFLIEVPTTAIAVHKVTVSTEVSAGAGGSVSPSGIVNVAEGASKTFTFLPEAGCAIDQVLVNNLPVTITGNSYTLSNLTANTTLSVRFRAVTPTTAMHTVTITAGTNGTVSPSGTLSVRHGQAQTLYFYPAAGYTLDRLTVGGTEVNVIGDSFTLTAVEADTAVSASFRQVDASVQPPNVHQTITATAGANGTISPAGGTQVEYGGGLYYYFIPNTGYEVDAVTVDGSAVAVAGNRYQFVNVVADRAIHVTFKALPSYHSITASAGANGSVSPSGAVQIANGGSQTFQFIPDTGYTVDTVTVDGTPLTSPGNSYTFTDVTGAHTLAVTFQTGTPTPATLHTITAGASGTGGTISPTGAVRVAEGGSQTFYFIPDAGYILDTVTVDGVPLASPGNSYTFTNVTSGSHTILATFRSVTQYYAVTVSASGGGTISPSGSVQVPAGGAQTFYFIPNSGYKVLEVWVDGVRLNSAAYQYTFTDVRAAHTLHVVFDRTATPPTGDADSKLLWTLLAAASILLLLLAAVYMRRLREPENSSDADAHLDTDVQNERE